MGPGLNLRLADRFRPTRAADAGLTRDRCAGSWFRRTGFRELARLRPKAKDDPDRWLWSATIVTTDARGPAAEVHDRTPLILPGDRVDAWLDPTLTDPAKVQQVLQGVEMEPLEVRPVSTAVNKVGTNGPELLDPLNGERDRLLELALSVA